MKLIPFKSSPRDDLNDKEAEYSRMRDYYESNVTIGLPSTYNTIFKDIDLVLKNYLMPITLSIQRAQMKQALLYQGTLITLDQINESDSSPNEISDKAVFHLGLIHTRWVKSMPSEAFDYITVSKGTKSFTTNPLYYIDNIRAGNVYTSPRDPIRNPINPD
ncbi:hypothetical protein C2G38_2176968 [Gigaspora rosea]|uniref:Uncharacterized protein n=1 Tax=Gigaspora rosea TaxID=44941 RepID=A0A397VJV3_9GLOM|nr:hypothetical protein C2G38_2176968 [Gigaspora rosea]